jgi:hypothetical protein
MVFQIPIFCAQCNTIYPSGIALGQGASISIKNSVYGCPRGHDSQIPDGTFSVRDGLVQVSTESGSEPVLERIRRLATDAVKGKSNAEEAIKAIESLAPGLSPVLKLAGTNNSLLVLALLLWFIVEMTKAFNAGSVSNPIHIENRPTIINKITIDSNISSNFIRDDKNSKRKQRRLRGKYKQSKR